MWEKLKSIFFNHKVSRAVVLEREFKNLTLSSMNIFEYYCQKLKDLDDQLQDVKSLVYEKCLVLQLVCGLPLKYDIVVAYIHQNLPD